MGVGASILGFMALNIKGIPLCLCFYCCLMGISSEFLPSAKLKQGNGLSLRSTFAIFDCIEDRMRLGHAKLSKLLLHGARLSLRYL